MSSVYVPRPVRKRKSSLRLTLAPMPVAVAVPSGISLPSHRLRAGLHGLDDVVVARTAADIAVEAVADLLFAETGVVFGQRDRGHHHARGTEAALQAVIVAKGLLHRMQGAVLGEAFD